VWVFILGDMLVFGLFFGVFMIERGGDLEGFREGRDSLSTTFGAVNTLLLLLGSILVVLAMRAVRTGSPERASRLILGAMATGALFVVNKAIEYADKLDAGITPGDGGFSTLFYAFTGIHLLHLLIGMGALVLMRRLATRTQPRERDVAFIAWHFMEARDAPLILRLILDAYVIAVGGMLVAMYLLTA
jgi:nitric oxide reductase NorE protein